MTPYRKNAAPPRETPKVPGLMQRFDHFCETHPWRLVGGCVVWWAFWIAWGLR